MRLLLVFIFCTSSVFSASENPVFAKQGMVVSASSFASQAGVDIMKKGGNAVDAAVAVGFVLAVTRPQAGNLGGGGFLVAKLKNGEAITVDFRETAPEKSHRDLYLDDQGEVVDGLSLYSHLAVGIPGSVAGMLDVWEKYGSGNISRKELLKPAIKLAKSGFQISHYFAGYLNSFKDLFEKNEAANRIFIRSDGRPWQTGDLLIQKDLAATLKRISKYGKEGFYSGKTAAMIINEMTLGDGLISANDLMNYTPMYRNPVEGTFHDYEIISMGPPSSGGALLIQMLNMLEPFDLDSMGWNSSEYIHLLTEVERRAYADRAEHMGDPQFWDVPLDILISKDYARQRLENVSLDTVTPSDSVFPGNPLPYESRETTHYSVADSQGNAVSVTTTLNTSFGSGIVVSGAGFFLNNEMDDFSAKPGVPNVYGLVGNEANSIAPGKRPLSSMTPTIVLKNQKPYMIIGSPGGSAIITTTLQTILNVVIHEMDIKEAVSVPRIHSQWLPDVIVIEPRSISKDVKINLEAKGHHLKPYKWGYLGRANGILIEKDGLYGGGDPRGQNSAIGF